MKCKNCGAENSEDTKSCKKCGKLLINSFKLYWINIAMGTFVSLIILAVLYGFFGASNTFFYGVIPVSFTGGIITAVFARNKNISSGEDLNPTLNGGITGLIIGFIVIISVASLGTNGFIFILVPGYAMFGLFGGMLGALINLTIEKCMKWTVPLAIILIIGISFIGYTLYNNQMENNYEDSWGDQIYYLAFDDLIQQDAENLTNDNTSNTQERIVNLNAVEKEYQQMKIITEKAEVANNQMEGNSTSKMEKEYAKSLRDYIDLRYEYYNEMEAGITSEINENNITAQTHYKNAKQLLYQMEHQESLLQTLVTQLTSKNTKLKKFTENIHYIKNSAKIDKSENKTFT